MSEQNTAVLEVSDFSVELMTDNGVFKAVKNVNFRIGHGETVTIIGESGSGKSTTAMGLLQLLPRGLAALSGQVRIKGEDVLANPKAIAKFRGRGLALIPQDPMTALNPVATIGSQLREAIKVAGRITGKQELHSKAVQLLEQVRIPLVEEQLKKFPHQLSGGMLQRVLIAIALASEPELLVADEPTSALDVTVQAGILDLLLELQQRSGISILMITHDIGVARLVSDTIHVMSSGKFVESGPAAQIVDAPEQDYTRKLLAAVPRLGTWDETPMAPKGAS
ncbi:MULTISPECIES: ABC transporter ATP-binding protein [Glutamicibacter]|uniref:ABC transporter ATP-binding protein n=1 Tax=Glutamicibacter halophytocola TaxID=1933880 RepID=A0A5B8IMP1_9MICC|nr:MULTISPECIES: ABC transporter ATP-binding protein [Glutamicibacter]ALG30466.1 hypothetical protein AOZ07_16750 [Glutamicibacter halophytocola]MBF6670348.1 ABC transporter ATP-binding protein [Glutamicibacter sp. FBE19]QDY66723.1 ABC transporter ATP-binding protein [Glutamicibacter halophytocola]UUX58851.1 ABC transporter ATP-binding protein [Glutamicibacter halophytocola]